MSSHMWADLTGDKQRSSVSVPKTVRNRCFPMFLGPMKGCSTPRLRTTVLEASSWKQKGQLIFIVGPPIAFAVQNQTWKSMFRTLGTATRSTCSGFCLDLLEHDGDGNTGGVSIGEWNMALLSVRKLVS